MLLTNLRVYHKASYGKWVLSRPQAEAGNVHVMKESPLDHAKPCMETIQGLKRKEHEEFNAMGSVEHGSHAKRKRLPQGGREQRKPKRPIVNQERPSKKVKSSYQWRGENHLPAILAKLPNLAKRFPQFTGRPPDMVE